MTSRGMDKIADALQACEEAGMSRERVGASQGDICFAFLMLSGRPDQVSEAERRASRAGFGRC